MKRRADTWRLGDGSSRLGVAILVAAALAATSLLAAGATESPATRQLLIVSPGYWRAGDAAKFSFEVCDLGEGGKRIHLADPGKVGEIRGMCLSPATQRLYVSGHEGLLCYDWPGRKLLWRVLVEGAKANQNDAITVNVDGARLYTIRHFGRGLNVYDANDGKRLRSGVGGRGTRKIAHPVDGAEPRWLAGLGV
jgi:hypothetical protein